VNLNFCSIEKDVEPGGSEDTSRILPYAISVTISAIYEIVQHIKLLRNRINVETASVLLTASDRIDTIST
jgi:hypothetical protein